MPCFTVIPTNFKVHRIHGGQNGVHRWFKTVTAVWRYANIMNFSDTVGKAFFADSSKISKNRFLTLLAQNGFLTMELAILTAQFK